MAKKPMCPMALAEATAGEAVMDMNSDESALILLQHCRDMKQQETRLRLATLLLLLACAALFLFSTCADLKRQSQGSNNAAVKGPAYTRQEKLCPAEDNQIEAPRMRIHLTSVGDNNPTTLTCMTWSPSLSDHYNKQNRSIVIPAMGVYFVYMKFDLFCSDITAEDSRKFQAILKSWNSGYSIMKTLAVEHSAVNCSLKWRNSVFVGQLFDLLPGDHLSVWIQHGYKLIQTSSFGVFLV